MLGVCAAMWAVAAEAEPVTLLAFGDSLTQGYGLEQGSGLVPQLEDWLKDQGREVTVINGGVSGDTTAGGLARIDWSLTPEVEALMVILGGNDLLRGTDPATVRANLEGILQAGASRDLPMLLVGMQSAQNFGADYKAAFDAIYPELADQFETVFVPSFLGLLSDSGDPADLRGHMQPDGIHPSAQGVARIVEALGPSVLEVLDRVPDKR
ncbi:arylesterase [Pseudooceanicola sp. HF7]|uniref:arylesterase n=1 Tax=Pseudooceanicola sp. HF7 TaxID=2721560 RepID=UPI0020CA2FF8|nr:arylesterase [Pseudooceanicola sp. HF7]